MPPLVDSCQWSQFSGPSISRISTYLTLREKKPLYTTRKSRKSLRIFICESFCDERGGVILVNCEPQLHRMMFYWNEKLLSSSRHLSSQTPPTFLLSCVYQLVSKHPGEPFLLSVILKSKKKHLNIYKMVSVITWNSVPGFHIITSFHIITDLSSAVFGEVMLKLASSLLQHHPLHIHYPSTIPTLAYSSTIKTPAQYMLSLPALSLACIKDVVVKARYVLFFSSGRVQKVKGGSASKRERKYFW